MRSLFGWLCVGTFLVTLAVAGWFCLYISTPVPGNSQVTVAIPKGAGVRKISTLLADNGIIKQDVRFLVLVRLLDKARLFKAGEYRIAQGLTPLEVLQYLESAKPIIHRITLPEGWTMQQIASAFAADHWVDAQEFLRLCRDKEFIQKMGFASNSLEGYLFPDTYTLIRGEVDTERVIKMLINTFNRVWSSLDTGVQTDLTRHELVTLASIVEKETGAAEERPVIAGVFYNRLKKGMRLQSDPTTIYGLTNFNGNLTRKDLQTATPYNTYVIPGLPPGPICNPGRAALAAVLHPAKVGFYYFVSKNNGTHQFSRTLQEHNRFVRLYQKRRGKK